MEQILAMISELLRAGSLCWHQTKTQTAQIKTLIIDKETFMIGNFFKAFEAMLRALIYLLTLIIGLSATALGSYFMFFVCLRVGQFLWVFMLKEPWL